MEQKAIIIGGSPRRNGNTDYIASVESAGMIAASIGYEAILKGKEKLPLRTGNPPGELVE